MMDYSLEKVKVDPVSLNEILNLLKLVFPKSKKFSFDYLKWQYVLNPVGYIVGYNAYHDGILAAHYVTMPITMNIKGEKHKGLLSLNTATHPQHRGQRLFSILAEKTYDYAANNGFEFVVGVSNANSTHGFIKNLGFMLVSPLVTKVGIGTGIYKKNNSKCFRQWDKEQLEWRLKNPACKYYVHDGFVFTKMGAGGIRVLMGYVPSEIMNQIDTEWISKSSVSLLNLYVGLGVDLSKGVYFNVPHFVKRSPLNLIFRDLSGNIPRLKEEDFFFQLIDFDVL